MPRCQRTLAQSFSVGGVGVHSGVLSRVTVGPAPAGAGLVWRSAQGGEVRVGSVVPPVAAHATVLPLSDGRRLSTVEHLMAALSVCGIDNAVVTLEGDEVPILDGSALIFVALIKSAGVIEFAEQALFCRPRVPIKLCHLVHSDISIELFPHVGDQLSVDLRTAAATMHYDSDKDSDEIVAARTFGRMDQIDQLRAHGLARGATTGNSLVLTNDGKPLNTPRFATEAVCHKLLDLIGDLRLLPAPLAAHVTAHNVGHHFNREVVAHYLAHPDQWELS